MRFYDRWAGNPKGIKEDLGNCIASVGDFSGWHHFQCTRKRGHGPDGLYCKQHSKMKIERLWIPENEGKDQ